MFDSTANPQENQAHGGLNGADHCPSLEEMFGHCPDSALNLAAELPRLAALDPQAYEHQRKDAAEKLQMRASKLDEAVEAHRKAAASAVGNDSIVEDLEPWPEKVDAAALLDAIRADFQKHVIADNESIDVLAIWCFATFAYDAYPVFPKLLISSPEKRCGKSTCLDVVQANCSRQLTASSITASAIFRVVELAKPTLILDEADRLPKDNDELIGIINCGHKRSNAHVVRTVKTGDDHTPRKFSTWAPMCMAAIGNMPSTVMDRSVVVHLRRKAKGETVQKVPIDLLERNVTRRRQCLRWAIDNDAAQRQSQPTIPSSGNDRDQDNWFPLLALAESMGGDWLERMRAAYVKLTARDEEEELGPMLLSDIREIFDEGKEARVFSKDLVTRLTGLEGRPWMECSRGKPITQNNMAWRLKPYDIKPQTIRHKGTTGKGYYREQFEDAWRRYLDADADMFSA